MGYEPDTKWVGRLYLGLADGDKPAQQRILAGVQLTVQHAIAELRWKIERTPEFGESSSLERAIVDLEAAAEGLEQLAREASARQRRLP